MGTRYSITIRPQQDMEPLAGVAKRVQAELDLVNTQMSTYDPESELSRFNESESTDWFEVSAETATVVTNAQAISELSEGAFDVTVGPLVNLWGFGPEGKPEIVPTDEKLVQRLTQVGYQNLSARSSPPALKKAKSNLVVDLSAIAKGHGVDRVAKVLDDSGIENYFIEIGGEVRTRGTRYDGRPWQVGIERPSEDSREIFTVIGLSDMSLATSGNYRNYYISEGVRYSHTIDPNTGRPAENAIASASAVASTCEQADAIATTMMSMGEERGLQLANSNDWAVLLLIPEGDDYLPVASERFRQMFPAVGQLEEVEP